MDCRIIRMIFYGCGLFCLNKNDNFTVWPVLFGRHDYEDSILLIDSWAKINTDLITVT